jgi:putative membrane protein
MAPEVLDNEGSAARDHLANERTFLAWFRTALGLVGLGVVVERIQLHGELEAKLAGLSLIAFGAACMIYGVRRYLNVADHLSRGRFPQAKAGPIALSIAALVITVAAVIYLMA